MRVFLLTERITERITEHLQPGNKIEEKDKNLSGSIPQYEGIQNPKTNQQEEAQPIIPKSPTKEEYHLCFDTYNVCLNLQNQ